MAHQALLRQFNRVYSRGRRFVLWSALRPRPPQLLDLTTLIHDKIIRGARAAGLRATLGPEARRIASGSTATLEDIREHS